MKSRAAALAIGYRASRRLNIPVELAMYIAFACRKERVRWALGYALVQQESNFRHIFGHDAGGLFKGLPVTRSRYRRLRSHLQANGGRGANGVGYTQITYYTYILQNPGLWKRRANVYFGLGLIATNIRAYGERKGLAVYNGGAGNPQYDYADEVLRKAAAIRPKLRR